MRALSERMHGHADRATGEAHLDYRAAAWALREARRVIFEAYEALNNGAETEAFEILSEAVQDIRDREKTDAENVAFRARRREAGGP